MSRYAWGMGEVSRSALSAAHLRIAHVRRGTDKPLHCRSSWFDLRIMWKKYDGPEIRYRTGCVDIMYVGNEKKIEP